jgi:hypothetical protein
VDYAGVNPANGEPLYRDLDGNITNEYSDAFRVLQEGKSPVAEFEGGFYTNFRYRGLGVRADFVYRYGNYIMNFQRQQGLAIGNIDSNLRTDAFNYWKQPGDQNVEPSPLFQGTADQSSTTRWLERGDYVRLRTLTVDYSLPSKFLDNTFLDSFRVFLQGQNLLTITDFEGDPEIGLGSAESGEPGDAGFVPGSFNLFSYPQSKIYTFGFEIGF